MDAPFCRRWSTGWNKLTYAHSLSSSSLFFKPSFRDALPLNENRVLCLNDKPTIDIKQPNYLGFHILELAKIYMYRFWYKVQIQDTNSFIISFDTSSDATEDLMNGPIAEHIDYTNFPEHPYYNSDRKGELGLLKLETGARIIKVSIALKMYSLLLEEDEQFSLCKGVPVHHQKLLMYEDYKHALTDEYPPPVVRYGFRNIWGQISTTLISKRTLSKSDDKRYHLDNNTTVGYFHPDFEWPWAKEEAEEQGKEICWWLTMVTEMIGDDDDVYNGERETTDLWSNRKCLLRKLSSTE